MYNREYTPERISELKPNEIFVFGSNLAGAHGGGAARMAYNRFGAIWGQGIGLQGQCYAIPTMQGGVETLKPYVDEFISFASIHREYKFLVTRIGCGIAGFTSEEIAPLFQMAIDQENVILPQDFVEVLARSQSSTATSDEESVETDCPAPTSEQDEVLKLWTMGAGNSAKRFNGENPMPAKSKVATKDSWKNLPMPEKKLSIKLNVTIPKEAMHIIKYGHIPEAMEDHWFMYCDEDSIRYYRSWSGICIFEAKYEPYGDDFRITALSVNRDPEQYGSTDADKDAAHFLKLLTEECGSDAIVCTLLDRIRGSLVGGAIGDALGYPVEFVSNYKSIQHHYGERGITRLDTHQRWLPAENQTGKAVISDDTQMTLFTANGLLNAKRLGLSGLVGIQNAYVEWYFTLTGRNDCPYNDCWIARVPELNARRAPGNTCMTALESILKMREPQNDSKGCGGVMRVAPIPLYAAVNGRISIEDADRLAGDAAKLTHKHPLGFIPAALMAHIIYRITTDNTPTRQSLEMYIREGLEAMKSLYPLHPFDVAYMRELADKAVSWADNDRSDVENIEAIGGGWTGEEALAIALYCACRHFDNFENALIAAVNHAGDSDSTGAITGNILGAAIGYEAVPKAFLEDLELHDVILHMADDLFLGKIS